MYIMLYVFHVYVRAFEYLKHVESHLTLKMALLQEGFLDKMAPTPHQAKTNQNKAKAKL